MKVLLLLAFVCFSLALETFENHQVLRFNVTSEEQLNTIKHLEELQRIDLWSENIGLNQQIDVRVPSEFRQEVNAQFFDKFNVKYSVFIQDLQKVIDEETNSMKSRVVYDSQNKAAEDDFFNNFRTLAEINAWVKNKAETNKLCTLVNVGKSFEKRDILGLKISGQKKNRGSVLFHGGIHSREWISPTTVMWIAHELITKYDSDPIVKKMVDNLEWHIFPVINVDGFAYTHSTNRMWRKTRQPNAGSSCIGTDPNRNWPYKWNTGGSSSNPCSETFHGTAPFSQVECKQLSEYGAKLPNLKAYIDFHAYGQLYMRPWGWSREDSADEARLKEIGDAAAAKISAFRRKIYRSGKIAVIIYVASGSTADWFYGEKKVMSYALELGTGFSMPASEIKPVGQENFEGVKVLAEKIY